MLNNIGILKIVTFSVKLMLNTIGILYIVTFSAKLMLTHIEILYIVTFSAKLMLTLKIAHCNFDHKYSTDAKLKWRIVQN